MERLDDRRGLETLAVAQDLAKVGDRLLRAAQDRVGAAEDLHGHDRIEAFRGQDPTSALEVDVSRLTRQDVIGRLEGRRARAALRGDGVGGHGPAV